MKVSLPNGGVAEVFVQHLDVSNPDDFQKLLSHQEVISDKRIIEGALKPRRVTVAEVKYNGATSKSASICHENDNFNRRVGTAFAMKKALKGHSDFANDWALRQTVYNYLFRPESCQVSPYQTLMNLVSKKPDLAENLIAIGSNKDVLEKALSLLQ